MIEIAALSDIHGYIDCYEEIYPTVELVIVPGDLCGSDNIEDQEKELPEVISKLERIFPACHELIIVPGNHDYFLEKLWKEEKLMPWINEKVPEPTKVKVLVDELHEYGSSLRIYGSPRTDLSMAFPGRHRRVDILRIPPDLDILVTHEAPRYYNLQCVKEYVGRYGNSEPGSKELYERVKKIRPKYHFFGHIHRPCEYTEDYTKFFNVSQLNGADWVGNIKFIKI